MSNQEPNPNDTTNAINPKSSNDKCVVIGIYGLQNKSKLEAWNVGQSWDIYDRWYKAYERIKCVQQPKIYNALKKYGYNGFNKVILETCPKDITEENEIQKWLNEREIHWIKLHRCLELGYNCREGGDSGGKLSTETKKKLSDSHMGKPSPKKGTKVPRESVEKMVKSLTGKKYGKRPQEWVDNLKNAWVERKASGWKHSESSKLKMSKSKLGRKQTLEHIENKRQANLKAIRTH